MRRSTWLVPATLLAAAALGGCGGRAPQSSGASASQPQTAPRAVPGAASLIAATRAMETASSYRFAGSVSVASSTTRVAGEFEAPDRVHELITTPQGATVEVVFAGPQVFVRDRATGRWSPERGTGAAASDPRHAFLMLEQATSVAETGDGSTFTFALPATAASEFADVSGHAPAATAGQGSATVAGGVLSTLRYDIAAPTARVDVLLTYTDVGHAPPVSLP